MKFLLFLIIFHISLLAHPHFFIDVDVVIDKNKITHYWSFDRINSQLLRFEFDKNKDKVFQKEEQVLFYNTYISKIKNNNFNIFLESNNKEYIYTELTKYDMLLKNKKVIFSFVQNIKSINEMTLCNIDPTIYMAFKLNKIDTNYKVDIQKSQYDFCIGVDK